MSDTRNLLLSAIGAAALAFAAAPAVQAAQILSDHLVVYNKAGVVKFNIAESESRENPGAIFALPNKLKIDPAFLGQATYLVEPATGQLSDIFGICTCGPKGKLALGFASDSDQAPVTFSTNNPIVYTEFKAGPYDATFYLSPKLKAAGWTAYFYSDGASVPEPGTWALMLTGAALTGFALRRRAARLAAA